MAHDQRPYPSEYAPYYRGYIDLVPGGPIVSTLAQQRDATLNVLRGLSEREAAVRYAPDKWSVKQVIGHLIDTERVFAYRALCISRGESQPLPGFDENAYVQKAEFDQRTVHELTEDYRIVRESTLALFRGFTDEMMHRRGIANEHTLSVRAAAYIIAGHERHHLQVLQNRYMVLFPRG